MRKFLSFFAAMLVAVAVNAVEIPVNPGLNTLLTALNSAADGDVVVLADGNYTVDNYIVLGKSIELKADENATPVVEVNTYIKVQDNASVKITGIKFDGTNQGNYSHFIRIYSVNSLEFEGCEICNAHSNIMIKVEGDQHIGSLKLNNCYLHDGNNTAISVANGTSAHACDKLQITNSTFMNFSGFGTPLVSFNTLGGSTSAEPELLVDHCTFYNFTKTEENTYGFIDSRKCTNVLVSNCITVNPATIPAGAYSPKATQLYGGTVANCLINNVPNHRTDAINLIGSLKDVDPLFTDEANGDLTLKEASPAVDAGTDGNTLGDPRWWPVVVLPETDFATPYVCAPAAAKCSNKVALTDGNLVWDNNTDATLNGVSTWKIKATRACYVSATVTEESGSGHHYSVEILDAEGKSVGDPVAEVADTWKSGDLALPGTILIPEVGEYAIKLTNLTGWSKGTVSALTLAFAADAPTTAIENTNAAVKTVKKIENGQMIIIKNGVKYNALGTMMK